jgi:NAD(P)-dependent dehydrogenase (short-subunit alcohol dehydrogenase family)
MTSMKRVALVTGSSRGVGLEMCRQLGAAGYAVVLTARDPEKGGRALRLLLGEGLAAHFQALDVTDPAAVRRTAAWVESDLGRLDALINNAAVSLAHHEPMATADPALLRQSLDTNLVGVLACCQAFLPLMLRQGYGRIVNVSSGRGSFSKLAAGGGCYRISKTALNALTVVLADELKDTNILVNAMTTGWVRTRMGGIRAPRSVAEGADTAVWLAMLPDGGPRGQFFRDRQVFPW